MLWFPVLKGKPYASEPPRESLALGMQARTSVVSFYRLAESLGHLAGLGGWFGPHGQCWFTREVQLFRTVCPFISGLSVLGVAVCPSTMILDRKQELPDQLVIRRLFPSEQQVPFSVAFL